ncbi:hypothetical protein I549_3532 [Mycobacterium avium subsp. avium 2285 (R)]|uniref:Uncharacterized protein n=1 Tax=Mycobacterium avium (strain 104) TaxID=243243 RepID=A0A0H2ZUI3_MYCA1|nr:hypothetical protein MAV_2825 [Mycobacterium avium 104]EUA40237.1 hypothetical protein I549_3532 [Mycobacterium avium subsp. avium 2285 (R)]
MVKRPRITTERNIAMALDQSALLEVLGSSPGKWCSAA